MAVTLAEATLKVSRLLMTVVEGAATGGSTTTLVDTAFPWLIDGTNPPQNDYFNGGTLWFIDGANAGLTAVVSDWDRATKTATFPAMAAVAAGNLYAIAPKDWPRFALRQAVNQALDEIGNVDRQYSDAAFVTVANQMDYTLPAGISDVRRVEVAQSTTAPYEYMIHSHYREIGGAIQFVKGFEPGSSGHRIRLTYNTPVAHLTTDTGTIPDLINRNWLTWESVVQALRWRVRQTKTAEKDFVSLLNEALGRAEAKAAAYRANMEQMPRDPIYSIWAGGGERYIEEVNRVRLR